MKPPPATLPDTDDPYVLLDVRPGASVEQIRRAYLRRVKLWKPDRHPAEFRRVREAYDRLREQEKWFDAWRQAGDVVRRAAEEAVQPEDGDGGPTAGDGGPGAVDETAAQAAPEGLASEPRGDDAPAREPPDPDAVRAEIERALDAEDAPDDDDDAEQDIESLIAALEDELRSEGEETDLDEDDEDDGNDEEPVHLSEAHRRRYRTADHLLRLVSDVHAALEAGRFAEAADRLLEPGTETVAAHREFAPLLLEVCCAVVWELPPRFAALVARYGDVVSGHDTEHRDGALLHRRILEGELPGWRLAVADWPELHRFVVLGSSLRAPAEAELGLRLGRRAAADPTAFLGVLGRAAALAPGIVGLYVGMAERWTRSYGRLPLQRPARARPSLEQAADALADAAQHHRRVRWEQARPLLTSIGLVLVPLLAPAPFMEVVLVGLLVLLWAWRSWGSEPAARIYSQVVRPAAAAWLWATHVTPEALATAMQSRLPRRGSLGAVLHPCDLDEYPRRLRDDVVLLAFGATSSMIPLLRTTSSPGSPS